MMLSNPNINRLVPNTTVEATEANESTDEECLEIDIKFINSALADLGLEAPFPFASRPRTPLVLYQTRAKAATLIALISARQRDNAYRQDAEERIKRLGEEVEYGRVALERCFSRLQASEAELRALQEECRVRGENLIQIESLAKSATDECSRIRSAFLAKERHFTVR
jgi:hypothetical protein